MPICCTELYNPRPIRSIGGFRSLPNNTVTLPHSVQVAVMVMRTQVFSMDYRKHPPSLCHSAFANILMAIVQDRNPLPLPMGKEKPIQIA